MNPSNLSIPKHLAVIMDGNGRWALKSGLSRHEGHRKGSDAVNEAVKFCLDKKIKALTLYAFSTENWLRPAAEIDFLMDLLHQFLTQERSNILEKGIRLNWIGRRDRIKAKTKKLFLDVIAQTNHNTDLVLNLAIDYGSRDEILRAAKKLAQSYKEAKISLDDFDETDFSQLLDTEDLPEVDLLIRSSGEYRLSNFLLYQAAYAELYFTDKLWPDFEKSDFEKALESYSKRNRKFGKTSQQLK